ncbi:hypothetical protein [Caulobacter sp.]|uniref:bestrophin-like domain n=1 Tax=Caulobacter sp. TaxID=78 RepID=UPI003BB1EA35
MAARLLDQVATWPPWLLALLLLCAAAGAWLGGVAMRRPPRPQAQPDPVEANHQQTQEAYVVAAILGLLALLLGFTFFLAVDGYQTRRALVLDEANAIGTAHLRARLLDEPHRTVMAQLLEDYVEARIRLATARPGEVRTALAVNDRLAAELWQATEAAFPSVRSTPFAVPFLDAVNEVLNLEAARRTARLARVPGEVFLVLLAYFLATAALLGRLLAGPGARLAGATLIGLTVLSLVLVIDIDEPKMGGVIESQQAMETLKASFAPPLR